MKKLRILLCLALAAVLCLGLAACGQAPGLSLIHI